MQLEQKANASGVDPLFADILTPFKPYVPTAYQLSDREITELERQEPLPPNRITPLHASEQEEE